MRYDLTSGARLLYLGLIFLRASEHKLEECEHRHASLHQNSLVFAQRDSHMKGMGILVVLLRGINYGFWLPLGRSAQDTNIFLLLRLLIKK